METSGPTPRYWRSGRTGADEAPRSALQLPREGHRLAPELDDERATGRPPAVPVERAPPAVLRGA